MTPRTRTPDAQALEALLRSGDPIPDAAALATETATAQARTRRALAAADGAAAARRGASPEAAAPVAAVHAVCAAPWGPVHLVAGDRGLVAVSLRQPEAEFVADVARRLHGRVVAMSDPAVPAAWRATIDRTVTELDEYFAGRRTSFDVPVDLAGLSDWDRAVLGGAARLGYGEVTSYGRLARMIGRPGAARAVGGALGRNPVPIVVPCHRILAGDGTLGGYGGGWTGTRDDMLAIKSTLLAREGVRVPAVAMVG
ncbi:MAG: methylated-DNA--[protein]-cysteine S-methyltransferase [Chloroflexi bacterium]|jgi:methylated-DNA-[protein]-cysteine S-methyltransferase|nr:methylated-DNA--[protein]-cysteine S-methyltransferase [Chloroflexota bacterium]